ncbi:MAG: hypothetical protein RLY97_1513, partial [Pseudomonadota bacterium]
KMSWRGIMDGQAARLVAQMQGGAAYAAYKAKA